MERTSKHPNKSDLMDLVRNRNNPRHQTDVELLPGPDGAQADSSAGSQEDRTEDQPALLYDLGVLNASPPQ